MSAHDVDVVAFQVVEPFYNPVTHLDTYKQISRRFHVKEAAEQFAELARKAGHPRCYVREIMGMAEPEAPAKRRGR